LTPNTGIIPHIPVINLAKNFFFPGVGKWDGASIDSRRESGTDRLSIPLIRTD